MYWKSGNKFLIIFFVVWAVFYFVKTEKVLLGDNVWTANKASNGFEKMQIKEKKQLPTNKEKNKFLFFVDDFSGKYVLEGEGIADKSKSENWWLNSGALMFVADGVARTIFGELAEGDEWQKKYANYDSSETDGGLHPQNIFRLITKTKWKNFSQEASLRVDKYILSKDKHRSESNGFFLFNRYQDADNLYYTGLRVDGAAVIKKKQQGKYYLLGYEKVLPGNYDRDNEPNLIPTRKWLRIKSDLTTIGERKVQIKVFLDLSGKKEWTEVLNVVDDGKKYGHEAILAEGSAGIRSDFMDVEFDDYSIKEKNNEKK